jgi:hypothetical protein
MCYVASELQAAPPAIQGDTMLTSRPARAAVALVGAVITLFATSGVAAAQPSDPNCAPSGEVLPTYEVTFSKYSFSSDNFEHGPDWTVAGQGPGKLIMSRTVTASNTFSVSLEVPTSVISAALGFNVTEEVSYTAGFEFDMPAARPGHRWFVEAGTRDDTYVYDVQRFCLGFPDGAPVRGLAKRTGHLIYQWWGEPPGNPHK